MIWKYLTIVINALAVFMLLTQSNASLFLVVGVVMVVALTNFVDGIKRSI